LVRVKIDNLKDFSKSILSIINKEERINKLIKNDIKIKNDNLILSFVITFSEKGMFLLKILFGLTNLNISM
jgi:hypothetical protein